jgi:hypothetical protein
MQAAEVQSPHHWHGHLHEWISDVSKGLSITIKEYFLFIVGPCKATSSWTSHWHMLSKLQIEQCGNMALTASKLSRVRSFAATQCNQLPAFSICSEQLNSCLLNLGPEQTRKRSSQRRSNSCSCSTVNQQQPILSPLPRSNLGARSIQPFHDSPSQHLISHRATPCCLNRRDWSTRAARELLIPISELENADIIYATAASAGHDEEGHPECAMRISAIVAALKKAELDAQVGSTLLSLR